MRRGPRKLLRRGRHTAPGFSIYVRRESVELDRDNGSVDLPDCNVDRSRADHDSHHWSNDNDANDLSGRIDRRATARGACTRSVRRA